MRTVAAREVGQTRIHLDDVVGPGRLGGLLNTSPLEALVRRGTRWSMIGKNLEKAARAFKIAVRHAHSPLQLGADLLQQMDESCGFSTLQQVAVEA